MKTTSGLIIAGGIASLKWGKVIAVGPGNIKNGKQQPVDLTVG